MVYDGKNINTPMEMGDVGVPRFQETSRLYQKDHGILT
jgi:hypothetical protein